LVLALCVPEASADEIAVVLAVPMGVFFLLGHFALLVPSAPRGRERATPLTTVLAGLLLVILVFLPAALAYRALDIRWAATGALALCCASVGVIVTCVCLRRLQGGATSLFSRLAVVHAMALALATTGLVQLSSAWTHLSTRVVAMAHHRALS
jgi:Co/Zn/Cd efflux system component